MRHLRSLSLIITSAGFALVAFSAAGLLNPTLLLIGLLLLLAGVVKIVVLYLWRHLGSDLQPSLGSPDSAPDRQP